MNKCFLIAKVLNEPIFKFFFMEYNISICYFLVELEKKDTVKVFALNDLADFIYQNIHTNQLVCIDGSLSSKGNKEISVKINDIKILN